MDKQKRSDLEDFDNKFTSGFAVFGWTFVILFFPALCGMVFAFLMPPGSMCGCMRVDNMFLSNLGSMLILLSPVVGLIFAGVFSYQTILVYQVKRSSATKFTVSVTAGVMILMFLFGSAMLSASY